MIFTDRFQYSFGGEIPQRLGSELFRNEKSYENFCRLSSSEKREFIDKCKNMKQKSELKLYVDTMGESVNKQAQLDYGVFM